MKSIHIGTAVRLPSSPSPREPVDHRLIVGRNGRAAAVELQRSIGVERIDSNGHQLQHFAPIVFIGLGAGGGVGLGVVSHVQVMPHDRA